MLTEIGKELRKIRIDHDEKMIDMAAKLEKSPAFISAVETGKKAPPADLEHLIIRIYGLVGEAARRVFTAADRSRNAFVLQPTNMLGRDTAALMARRMNSLSHTDLEEIHQILARGVKKDE